jgi:hypothetical protein
VGTNKYGFHIAGDVREKIGSSSGAANEVASKVDEDEPESSRREKLNRQ